MMFNPGELQLRFGNEDSLSIAAIGENEIRLSKDNIILTDYVFVSGCVVMGSNYITISHSFNLIFCIVSRVL